MCDDGDDHRRFLMPVLGAAVLELAAQPAMQLLQQLVRKRLTKDEEQQFAEAIAFAIRNAAPGSGQTHPASESGLGRLLKGKHVKRVSKKAVNGLSTAEARSASISGLVPDQQLSSRQWRQRLQRDKSAMANLEVLDLAQAELTTARSARTPDLWRDRLFATLVERALQGREDQGWWQLLNSNGKEYSDEQILEWAARVVCGFEAVAREREPLTPLLEALDRQDQQVIQITTLEAMQGMRKTVALALCILVLAVPVDAEALHLLF